MKSNVKETREEHGTGFTAKALVETKVLQKTVNENHKLKISNSVEYFIKFEVPEDLIEKYESEPEKHIFQVDARSEDATERYPVDITVRQFGRMIAFQLPSIEKSQSENQVGSTNIKELIELEYHSDCTVQYKICNWKAFLFLCNTGCREN